MLNFSVIISTWKRSKEINLILSSLYKQTQKLNLKIQIIISDSHSCEQVSSVVKKAQADYESLVIEHVHTENVLATKRNYGLTFAQSDNLIFLDDDCVPADDFLEKCLNRVAELKEKKVFCGEVRFLPEQIAQSNYYYYRDSRHPTDVNNDKLLNEWTFVAMNFMISKQAILDNGLKFNESFVGYGAEDHDYGFQLIDKGFQIIQSNQRIWHYEYGGDIGKYAKKIYHTGRDGMKTMKLVHGQDYTRNQAKLKKVEDFFSAGIFGSLVYYVFMNIFFQNIVIHILKYTDNIPYFKFNILYRYIIISSYVRGIRMRDDSENDLRDNWYK